ncbi:2160_t:CDS:2 [Diversispora eburnea]|uniref:2160_t:CDS:1 n=1 Tax=Diversispora eburnea TaxID=1213867 RepID=A0A9N8YTS4_9GLOM|nr:2160_t:CDS:2 [Diversispora eburnea]
MKSQSLLLYLLALTQFLTITFAEPVNKQCIDYPNPLNPAQFEVIDCPPVKNDNEPKVKRKIQNFFKVDLNCRHTAAVCNKIKKAFDDAGKEISKVLKLKKQINVNATYESFSYSESNLLGSAYPARNVFLISDDKITRLYPQALVKQFSLNVHPAYNSHDINARFNADFDWYFKANNVEIKPNQYDFYVVILHELLHGLGFISSWNTYLETSTYQPITGLTPNYYFYGNKFGGFVENIFDRYLKLIENNKKIPLSDYTAQLNKSVPSLTPFNTDLGFTTIVKSSPKWKYAKSALKAATSNKLLFTPAKRASWKNDIYLEASLKPFVSGSSISHVSQSRYRKTSDFVMTYQQFPGESEKFLIRRGGNFRSPIGPRIISILESIGYATDAYPNPIKPIYINI